MRLHRVTGAVVVGAHRVGIVEIGHLALAGGSHRSPAREGGKAGLGVMVESNNKRRESRPAWGLGVSGMSLHLPDVRGNSAAFPR